MNSKDYQVSLGTLLRNNELDIYLIKNWIYKDVINVLDFQYKSIRFAIDILISDQGRADVFFVDRNSGLSYWWKKKNLNRFKLHRNLNFFELNDALRSTLYEIFALIDFEYKFRVSVVVPVHNRENLIKKCINSINNQTLDKNLYEVIFVDDCSTDGTVDVIKKFISNKINYTLLQRPIASGNACAPRNDGMKAAKGRYVFFLDSDDYLDENCLNEALSYAEKTNADVTFLKIVSDDENPRTTAIPIRTFRKGNVKRATVSNNHLLRSNAVFKFYKREFLFSNRLVFDQSLPIREDKLFNVQVLSKTNKVSIFGDKALIFVTGHDGVHLSRAKHDLSLEVMVYLNGYNWIYASDLDHQHCLELYNAWTIILIQRLITLVNSKYYHEDEKKAFFSKVTMHLEQQKFQLSEGYIYKEYRKYIKSLQVKDFKMFSEEVNAMNN